MALLIMYKNKEKNNLKNIKMFFIFMITAMLLLASAQRVGFLNENVGYWANNDDSCTTFPHTINNSNLAQAPRTSPYKTTATLNYIW